MNPDVQANAEVVARSYIPESAVNTAALTPEQQARQQKGSRIRKILEDTDDPIATLKDALGTTKETADLSTIDTDKEVRRRIHKPEVDSTGTVDAEQEALLNRALNLAKEAKIIAEKGLEGIVDASGNIDTARQQEIINLYISRVLDIRGAFSLLSPAEKSAIAKAELQKPEVREKIAELLKQALNPSEQTTDLDRELTEKEEQKKTKKKEAKEAKKKLKKAERTLREQEAIQSAHAEIDPATGTEGVRHRAIRELGNQIDLQLIRELKDMLISKKNTQDFQTYKELVLRKMAAGSTFDSEYEQFMAELIIQEHLIAQQAALIAERDSIDEKVKEARKEKKKAVKDRKDAKRAIEDLDDDIEELEEPRDMREEALVGNLANIISDAGNQVLNADNTKRLEALEADSREKADATNDADEKLLYNGLDSRWERVVIKNGERVVEKVPGQLESDWENAINTGNVMGQVEDMLIRSLRINRRLDSREEIQRKIAEARRIQERLKSDTDFARLTTFEYLTRLIGKRFETGKPFSKGELALFENYGWVDYIEQYVIDKNARNVEFKQKVDQLTQKAGGDQSHKIAALQEKYRDNWASIVAILLSGSDIPTDPGIGLFERLRRMKR